MGFSPETYAVVKRSTGSAKAFAEDSEAYAVGKRDGEDVPATDPAYHNNSAYYADVCTTMAAECDAAADRIPTMCLVVVDGKLCMIYEE